MTLITPVEIPDLFLTGLSFIFSLARLAMTSSRVMDLSAIRPIHAAVVMDAVEADMIIDLTINEKFSRP